MNEDQEILPRIIDIVAQDALGRTILLVEVRGIVLEPRFTADDLRRLEALSPSTPFVMVVDPATIQVKKNGSDLPPLQFETASILSHYEPEFGVREIYNYYLRTLVSGWLNDLAYHWKSESPPGSDALASLGLLERLEGGMTEREVLIGDGEDSLY